MRFIGNKIGRFYEYYNIGSGFVKLLGSAGLSAAALAIISSNRLNILNPSDILFLLIVIQWQTFGLTIAKLGIDQLVFAAISSNKTLCFEFKSVLWKQVVPLSVLFSLGAFWFVPWTVCFVIFTTIIFDTYSLVVIADMNARKLYGRTSFLNLMNYPAFFAGLFVLSVFGNITRNEILCGFLCSSFLRAGGCWIFKQNGNSVMMLEPLAIFKTGIQQCLNYFLFRADQIIIGLVVFKLNFEKIDRSSILLYLFLAKFPELTAGVANIAGTVLFPRLNILKSHSPLMLLWVESAKRVGPILFFSLLIVLCNILYATMWKVTPMRWILTIPFSVHALLIFPINAVTFVMTARGHLNGLNRNLLFSCSLGGLLSILFIMHRDLTIIYWIIPVQQIAFFLISTWFSEGKQMDIYVKA